MRPQTAKTFILLALALFFNGCDADFEELSLPQKNPTSYVFNCNIEELTPLISNLKLDFDSALIGWGLHLAGVKADTFYQRYFNLYGTEFSNDFIYRNYWSRSMMHKTEDSSERPNYSATFHLHLSEFGENKTKVEIITLDSHIHVNTYCIFYGPTFSKTYQVEPSTIEEYTMLKVIGGKLGDTTMPEIILPR